MKIIIHIQYGEENYYVKLIIEFLIQHAAAYGQLQSSVPDNANKIKCHIWITAALTKCMYKT